MSTHIQDEARMRWSSQKPAPESKAVESDETRRMFLLPVAASFVVLATVLGVVLSQVGGLGSDDSESLTDRDLTDGSQDRGSATTDETPLSGALAEIAAAGTVRVGIADEFPYGYIDDNGRLTGVGPEVARAVFEEAGITGMEPVSVEFGQLVTALGSGEIDLIAGGLTITRDRAERVAFADPHYCFLESMLVPEGNPFGLTDYESAAASDADIGVMSGHIQVAYLRWAGVPETRIHPIPGDALWESLTSGKIDAVAGLMIPILERATAMDGFETVPAFQAKDGTGNPVYECAAFGFAEEGLRNQFNEILAELKARGVVQNILEKQLQEPRAAEVAAQLTVEEVLAGS